jgi:hypothetical protein
MFWCSQTATRQVVRANIWVYANDFERIDQRAHDQRALRC